MGRRSREKRERRELGDGPVARAARGRSRASLLALLEAASVSPYVSHYLPSLSVIYESLASRTRTGDKHADPALLHSLVRAAHQECASVTGEEDFLPHDPRLEVRVEWSGEMLRMVGGTLERPTSVVETLRRLAATIDPVLHEQTRYGVTDIVELVLRRVDAVVSMLAPTWLPGLERELRSLPHLREEELAAAATLPPLEDQIAQCTDPERARAALEAHSVPANALRRAEASPMATFGSTIAIRHGQRGFTPLPAGLMVEALNALEGELATTSLALDPSLDERWQQAAWKFIGNVFTGAGNDVMGPMRDERRSHLHSVIRYNDSQHLAVGVAASLSRTGLQHTVSAAARCLENVKPGATVSTVNGTESIPNSAMLSRLLIVAAPQAAMASTPSGSSCAQITLQDFDWIRRTIGREEIDLWYFARDLAEQPRVRQVFSWDGIDLWETWNGKGKSLYRGARDLDILYVQPHHSLLEWQKASEQHDIELALHTLDMGRISAWPIHSLDGTSKLVGNALSGDLYQLVVCTTPAAVSLGACSGTEPTPGLARGLGECIAYKLQYSAVQFVNLMQSSGLYSLRIEFAFEDTTQNPPLFVESLANRTLTLGCALGLQEQLHKDSQSVESQFGVLLAEAIAPQGGTEGFVAAWNATPPGIRFDPIPVRPQIPHTPEATSLHAAHRSAHLAGLGAHLENEGITPGSYTGTAAKRIETDLVYRWLIGRLHAELSPFDKTAVLGHALTQLECTNCRRWWTIEKTAYEVGSASDDADRLPQASQELLRQSRFISLLIEETLARPPRGTSTPTEYEWQELLSLATLAGESGNRSETLHLELADHSLVVSDVYEITISESHLVGSIDFDKFSRDRSLAALPDPAPIGTTASRSEPDLEWTPLGVRFPEYDGIERSLQESLGFGIDTITITLDVIIHWPVSTPHCTELVSPEQIATEAHAANPAIPFESYTEAVAWLSLGTEDFGQEQSTIEHWEVEPRSARIATRPLARVESKVWVSPWTAEIARRIWINYLSQHRVPTPDSELPQTVVRAFDNARQARQREFEKECASRLDGLPLIRIFRLRKHRAHKHGIQQLSGEIDILCIDQDRSIIFVIEAKDPFTPQSARSINRQIAAFHRQDGHVETLTKKVEDIRASAVSLAANKGVDPADRTWHVTGIMVTRHVTPAAYLRTCETTFCTANNLRETVVGFRS